MPGPVLEALFPNLRYTGYSIESERTTDYNCIAWAAGLTDDWWWPEDGSYWPLDPKIESVQSFVDAFNTLGYVACDDPNLEPGFEKVAIYTNTDGAPTHMARQLGSGKWTSKCGKLEDIIHALEGLEGPFPAYGRVTQILRRPTPSENRFRLSNSLDRPAKAVAPEDLSRP